MLTTVAARLQRWSETRTGTLALKAGRYLFLGGILTYLLVQLTRIGWMNVWKSLPDTPIFYAAFLLIYFSLPIAETLIYRSAWRFRLIEAFPVFLKKRVLNKDVLGYSGEVFLYLWAKKHLRLGDRDILGSIKDNTIISSVASTFFAVVALAALFFTGQIAVGEHLTRHDAAYVTVAVLAVSMLVLLAARFRRMIFRLRGRTLLVLFTIHLGRLVVTHTLQVVQWAAVLPEVSLKVWFTYLALLMVTSRIPLIPGRDFIFLGAGLGLSRMMDVSSAAIAAMLLAATVLDKVLNFIMFTSLSFWHRKHPSNPPDEPPDRTKCVSPETVEAATP